MQSYETRDQAMAAAATKDTATHIAQVSIVDAGARWIVTKVDVQKYEKALCKSLPQIARVISCEAIGESESRPTTAAATTIRCERCGQVIDRATAYTQQEWTRLNGRRVRVNAYYCDDCRQLLTSVGDGETTDMDHRAGR